MAIPNFEQILTEAKVKLDEIQANAGKSRKTIFLSTLPINWKDEQDEHTQKIAVGLGGR